MRPGRVDERIRGLGLRRAGRVTACLGSLLVAPTALPGVQQELAPEVAVTVRLVSEGGGPLQGATLAVRAVAATPDSAAGWVLVEAPDGVASLSLRAGEGYRLLARAPGHRERTLHVVPSRPEILRMVLSVAPYELPPIVATSDDAPGAPAMRPVHHVEFEGTSLTYTTVAEWLADVPGVSVRSRGPGGRQVLSVRGSRPEDVLVLLDGVPLNDPVTGRADLSSIPTSTLEFGTLVQGAASQRYGSGASAGVLLLASRAGSGSELGGSLRMGSFGGLGVDMQAAAGSGGRRIGLSVSAARAENDFSFRNPVVPGGRSEVRSNADAASVHGALRASSGPLHASLRFDRDERGVPGQAGTSLFGSARADDRAWIAAAGISSTRVRASGSFGLRRAEYRASSSDPGSAQAIREFRLSGDADLPLVPVTVGGRLVRETVEGDLIEGTPGRAVLGGRMAVFLSSGRFQVDPAISLDISGELVAASPEVTATWLASSRTRIWGRVGQGFRLPTFGDLYFASRYQLRPNPDLAPERIAFDSEAGVSTWTSAAGTVLQATATAWARRTNDPIVWLPSAVAVWSPRNLDELRAAGVELLVELASAEPERVGWRAQVAATLQRSRVGFGSNRNPLPYEPSSMGRLSLEAWTGELGGRVDLRHTGSRTTGLAATRTLAAFTTLDVSARHRLRAGSLQIGLFLKVANLLDQRYQHVELFPEPGRYFTVRLEARRASS